jgi:7,8-dihydroneopterin aldolase/epimerase/oxygenase
MNIPDRIHLRDHVVAAEIGAFQAERGRTQRLRFGIEVALAQPVTGAGDQVDRILSYDVLVAAVAGGLADRRYALLETLAERIAAQVLMHPRAGEVTVTIEKLDRVPGALGVTLTRRTGQVEVQAGAGHPAVLFMGRRVTPAAGPLVIVPAAPGLPVPQGGDARRIALLALDQAAWALAGGLDVTVADSRTELDWAAANGLAVVWAPARMAVDARVAADPLALTLWLAERLDASRIDWALPEGAGLPPEAAGFRIPSALLGA